MPCDAVCRPVEDMSNPPPASLTDVILHWLLFSLLPQFIVTDLVWPLNFEDSSETGVNENLDILLGSGDNSPGLGSIQQYRFYNGVENPDLGVDINL